MILTVYKKFLVRPQVSDIDLLIDLKHVKQIVIFLHQQGFEVIPPRDWDKDKLYDYVISDEFNGAYLHALTFKKSQLVIDLHWRFVSMAISGDFITLKPHMRSLTLLDNKVNVFIPELMCLHIIMQGMSQPKLGKGILWIIDTLMLLQKHEKTFDWRLFAACAAKQYAVLHVSNFFKWVEQHLKIDYLCIWQQHKAPYKMPLMLLILANLKATKLKLISDIAYGLDVYVRGKMLAKDLGKKSFHGYLKEFFGYTRLFQAVKFLRKRLN